MAERRKDHPVRNLLTFYDQQYQHHIGDKAPINGAKDAAIFKKLMDTYSEDALRTYIADFFDCPDPFIRQSGYTVGVFKACLGKVIQFSRKKKPAAPPISDAVADPVRAWLEGKRGSGV